jgi:predicted RNA binding protein YcfA (HicA-like mRNA interferase family)
MKFKELVKELEALGYQWERGNGGHQVFKHPEASRPIVVPQDNKEKGHKIVSITIKKAKQFIDEGRALRAKRA